MLYRVKNKVIEANSNPFSEGFLYLTSYLTELRKQNPHSIIHLQHTIDQDGHKRFGRLMVMMRATSEIVVRSCKPVISLIHASSNQLNGVNINFLLLVRVTISYMNSISPLLIIVLHCIVLYGVTLMSCTKEILMLFNILYRHYRW